MSSGPQLVVQMSSDEAKLYQGFQKLIEQQARFQAGFDKTGKAAKQAEKDALGMGNVGKDILKDAGSLVTAWLSIGGAIRAATAVQETFLQAQRRAKELAEELAESRMDLAQIATSPTQLAELERRADLMSSQHGIRRDVARRLIGNATNFDMLDDTAFLNKAAAAEGAGVAPADLVAYTGGKVSSMFGGAVTNAQAANMAFAAAQKSPLTFTQMAPALPAAIATGKGAGATPEEIIGLTGFLAKRFKSGEEGSERFARLFSELSKDDSYRGKSAVEQLNMIRKLSFEGQKGVIGESIQAREALNQFGSNADMQEALSFIASVRSAKEGTGGANDAIMQQIGIAEGGDALRGGMHAARRRSVQAAETLKMLQEQQAPEAFGREEAFSVLQATSLRRDPSALTQTFESFSRFIADYTSSTESIQRHAASESLRDRRTAESGSQAVGDAEALRFRQTASHAEVMTELAEAAKNLAAAAQDIRGSTNANKANLQRQGASFAE